MGNNNFSTNPKYYTVAAAPDPGTATSGTAITYNLSMQAQYCTWTGIYLYFTKTTTVQIQLVMMKQ